jgi:acyl carrier protein
MAVNNVPVEETVKKIVTKIVRQPELNFSPTATFKDMKADSLDVVQILVALEDAYEIEIQDEDLKNVTNMGEFIKYIEAKVAAKAK